MGKILTDSIIPTLKAEMPTLPIATSGIADNSVTTPKLADGAVTAAKLANSGLYTPLWGLNVSPSNDTTTGWANVFGNKNGTYVIYYSQPNKFTNQPNQYGWLETHVYDKDIYQRWYKQSDGPQYYRGGNGTGWYSSASNTGGFIRVIDSNNLLNQVYPVGSVYISATLDTAAKVSTALGGGTWAAIGVGRTLVGVDTSDADFNQNAKSGGEKTVTLTVDQMPAHGHTIAGLWSGSGVAGDANAVSGYPVQNKQGEYTVNTMQKGGGQAHNNLQPYVTKYIWQRTA